MRGILLIIIFIATAGCIFLAVKKAGAFMDKKNRKQNLSRKKADAGEHVSFQKIAPFFGDDNEVIQYASANSEERRE